MKITSLISPKGITAFSVLFYFYLEFLNQLEASKLHVKDFQRHFIFSPFGNIIHPRYRQTRLNAFSITPLHSNIQQSTVDSLNLEYQIISSPLSKALIRGSETPSTLISNTKERKEVKENRNSLLIPFRKEQPVVDLNSVLDLSKDVLMQAKYIADVTSGEYQRTFESEALPKFSFEKFDQLINEIYSFSLVINHSAESFSNIPKQLKKLSIELHDVFANFYEMAKLTNHSDTFLDVYQKLLSCSYIIDKSYEELRQISLKISILSEKMLHHAVLANSLLKSYNENDLSKIFLFEQLQDILQILSQIQLNIIKLLRDQSVIFRILIGETHLVREYYAGLRHIIKKSRNEVNYRIAAASRLLKIVQNISLPSLDMIKIKEYHFHNTSTKDFPYLKTPYFLNSEMLNSTFCVTYVSGDGNYNISDYVKCRKGQIPVISEDETTSRNDTHYNNLTEDEFPFPFHDDFYETLNKTKFFLGKDVPIAATGVTVNQPNVITNYNRFESITNSKNMAYVTLASIFNIPTSLLPYNTHSKEGTSSTELISQAKGFSPSSHLTVTSHKISTIYSSQMDEKEKVTGSSLLYNDNEANVSGTHHRNYADKSLDFGNAVNNYTDALLIKEEITLSSLAYPPPIFEISDFDSVQNVTENFFDSHLLTTDKITNNSLNYAANNNVDDSLEVYDSKMNKSSLFSLMNTSNFLDLPELSENDFLDYNPRMYYGEGHGGNFDPANFTKNKFSGRMSYTYFDQNTFQPGSYFDDNVNIEKSVLNATKREELESVFISYAEDTNTKPIVNSYDSLKDTTDAKNHLNLYYQKIKTDIYSTEYTTTLANIDYINDSISNYTESLPKLLSLEIDLPQSLPTSTLTDRVYINTTKDASFSDYDMNGTFIQNNTTKILPYTAVDSSELFSDTNSTNTYFISDAIADFPFNYDMTDTRDNYTKSQLITSEPFSNYSTEKSTESIFVNDKSKNNLIIIQETTADMEKIFAPPIHEASDTVLRVNDSLYKTRMFNIWNTFNTQPTWITTSLPSSKELKPSSAYPTTDKDQTNFQKIREKILADLQNNRLKETDKDDFEDFKTYKKYDNEFSIGRLDRLDMREILGIEQQINIPWIYKLNMSEFEGYKLGKEEGQRREQEDEQSEDKTHSYSEKFGPVSYQTFATKEGDCNKSEARLNSCKITIYHHNRRTKTDWNISLICPCKLPYYEGNCPLKVQKGIAYIIEICLQTGQN